MLPGTLGEAKGYGVGNPRDLCSGRPPSLLKFQSLKSKKMSLKRSIVTSSVRMVFCVDDSARLELSTESTCQPSQPVNQCKKFSRFQDHAGFMPRVIQKRSGSPATSHHLCNCTGELCVHPVHLFTKLGTCPLTKSRGFPTPYRSYSLRGPSKTSSSREKSSANLCLRSSGRYTTGRWLNWYLSKVFADVTKNKGRRGR
jgi:hypothetical protein